MTDTTKHNTLMEMEGTYYRLTHEIDGNLITFDIREKEKILYTITFDNDMGSVVEERWNIKALLNFSDRDIYDYFQRTQEFYNSYLFISDYMKHCGVILGEIGNDEYTDL